MTIEETRLFAIPIARVFVPETAALKQQFMPEMLRRYQARAYDKPPLWETDRIHTSFDQKKKDQVIDSMPAAYETLLRQFVSGRFEVQLWHNVYWTGQEYQERHHHIPCHLSFIHFLAFDRAQHKQPVFYDPARIIKAHCRHDALPTGIWEEKTEIDVYEGDALIFPSYLEHHVPPGDYSKPRVTVSMNVTLSGNA